MEKLERTIDFGKHPFCVYILQARYLRDNLLKSLIRAEKECRSEKIVVERVTEFVWDGIIEGFLTGRILRG